MRENSLPWKLCDEPEQMVLEAFLNVTTNEIRNYMRNDGYINNLSFILITLTHDNKRSTIGRVLSVASLSVH